MHISNLYSVNVFNILVWGKKGEEMSAKKEGGPSCNMLNNKNYFHLL